MKEVRIVGAALPEAGLSRSEVTFAGDRILSCGPAGRPPRGGEIDGRGGLLLPGLVDIHIHGAGGADSTTPEELSRTATVLARRGVTSFLPTFPSLPLAELEDLLARARRAAADLPPGAAGIPGFHLEGPFLNPRAPGALDAGTFLPARMDLLDRILRAGDGRVRLMTVAPELDGASSLIRRAVKEGVVISMGHTRADTDQVRAAMAAGATRVTHLFNAMSPLHHRDPGPAGLALLPGGPAPEIIADCVHLSPLVMAPYLRLRGGPGEGLCLVSDALAPAGTGAQEARFCGRRVIQREGALYDEEGRLNGSALLLSEGVGRMLERGLVDPRRAARFAARNPARVAGLPRRGRIRPGWKADLALWREGRPVRCWVEGREATRDG